MRPGRGSRAAAAPSGGRAWPTALALLLICLVAVVPLLRNSSPCTHDGGLHYHRVIAMRQALEDGVLFTRYLPDLAFGYGYPFFNYREPLSYYLTLGIYLTGLALPTALNVVYVLSTLGCAAGAFLLARDLFGPTAGLVAAVAYAYAPYQFLDSLLRGNSPESVALAIVPFVLWAFRRLALTGGRKWFALSAGLLTALYLTHYISSLILAPILVAYLACLWLVYRQRIHWLTTGGALAIAFGMAAALVVPALLEQDYVQLHMSRVTRNNDFHYNFLRLSEILAPPAPVDSSMLNPPMKVQLGLAQAIMAIIGLVAGLARSHKRERRASIVFFGLLTLALIWMSTASSVWVWERLPLLPFVQFPWRFVGRAALPVALLASATFAEPLPRTRPHRLLVAFGLALALLVLVFSAVPLTFAPQGYCPTAAHPSIADVFAYERKSELVGVDPEGSYFPVWVVRRPVGSPLEAQYGGAAPVARFDETALPQGGFVVEADYGPNRARIVVDAPAPFRARYQVFYFPGWHVAVDGEPVKVSPSHPEGLLTFHIPEGRHTIAVDFRETPLRLAADIVSLASLAGLIIVALPIRGRARRTRATDSAAAGDRVWPPTAAVAVAASVAILSVGVKLLVIDRSDTPFRRPSLAPDGTLPSVQNRLDQHFADGLRLIGFDRSRATIAGDQALRIDLYWSTYAHPTAQYQSVVHLVGADGQRWSKPDSFRPRGYANYPPSTSWRVGQYALDSHDIEPLLGAPPGMYDIVLIMFDRDTLAPISTLDDWGQPSSPALVVGQVELSRPRYPVALDDGSVSHLNLAFGPVSLVTAHVDRSEMASGDAALMTVFWRSDRLAQENLEAKLVMVAPDGSPAVAYVVPLSAAWWPTNRWQPGDLWRGQHSLRIPATLETGDYRVQLSVVGSGEDQLLPISILVEAPIRSFTSPESENPVNQPVGDFATLIGYDLSATSFRPGGALTVTLAWQARGTPSESYHVFVHLIRGDGLLVAQSDGIPDLWTRPTTGWVAGEYIGDEHAFAIPGNASPGSYELRTGMYLPGAARLRGPEGEDSVALSTIVVIE